LTSSRPPTLGQLRAGAIELDAQHQTHAADRDHAFDIGQRGAEAGADGIAHLDRVGQQFFLLDGFEGGERRGAGEGIAAESGTMVARLEYLGCGALGQAGADRHASGEPLGQRNHIRMKTRVLIVEPFAGAAQAALDLIEHEQPLVFVA